MTSPYLDKPVMSLAERREEIERALACEEGWATWGTCNCHVCNRSRKRAALEVVRLRAQLDDLTEE